MNTWPALAVFAAVALGVPFAPAVAQPQAVVIRGGSYVPFYKGSEGKNPPVKVRSFRLDVAPVTNGAFLRFAVSNAKWRRSSVARVFADAEYLAHWAGDTTLAEGSAEQPVTHVSWFAARAYCAGQGGRLPSETEWEYVARADETRRDAQASRAFVNRIVSWYSRPTPDVLPNVRASRPNVWGLFDLHGLVWEWVADFSSSIVNVDSRSRGDGQMEKYCGGGALGAEDTANYAAFMRFAFRSSLRGSYTLRNLGFRCAYDEENP